MVRSKQLAVISFQAFNDDIPTTQYFLVPLMSEVLTGFDDLNGLLIPCLCANLWSFILGLMLTYSGTDFIAQKSL